MTAMHAIPGSTPLAHPAGAFAHNTATPAGESIVSVHVTHAAHRMAVREYADESGLTIVSWNPAAKFFRFRGTPEALAKAFAVKLHSHQHPNGTTYHSHAGPVYLPECLVGKVEAVLGLDSRPIARSHHRKLAALDRLAAAPLATGVKPVLSVEACTAYNVPKSLKLLNPKAATYIVELGGDYLDADTKAAFAAQKIAAPNVKHLSTDGRAAPSGGGLSDDATGEVHLDVQVAAAPVPYATRDQTIAGSIGIAANIIIGWAPNSASGYVTAIADGATIADVMAGSTSWGGPTEGFQGQERAMMEKALGLWLANGKPFDASAGDDGATDGTAGKTTDYPADSALAVAVCGTRLALTPSGGYAGETVWNNAGGGATGAGISDVTPRPSYQSGLAITGNGRIVGDIAANADPESGWLIWMGGRPTPIGGTSAGSPWYAGVQTLGAAVIGKPVGDFHTPLYAHGAELCNDVTQGNNNGFSAGPGFDVPSGWGSLNVGKWLAALQGSAPPGPIDPPPPPPKPTVPTESDLRAGLRRIFDADVNRENRLLRAAHGYYAALTDAGIQQVYQHAAQTADIP